ncbi:hypothetical protein [Streptomyces sp. NPDC005907]|uniref:hypothetical protein n=1 Tax=Streptomyces sp. NPDC005907 TaxID=3154571 RepID=UPI0033D68DEC
MELTKRESLILVLAGSLATSGVGRYEEHRARAERLVDEALNEHAHTLAEKQRAELDDMNNGPVYIDDREWIQRAGKFPDLIDPEVSS